MYILLLARYQISHIKFPKQSLSLVCSLHNHCTKQEFENCTFLRQEKYSLNITKVYISVIKVYASELSNSNGAMVSAVHLPNDLSTYKSVTEDAF